MGILHTTSPGTAGDTFSSSSQGTFTTRNYSLNHQTRLNKLKRSEIIQCLLSGKINKNDRKMAGKSQNVRRLSNILRNNTGAKEQISKKKKLEKILNAVKMKTQLTKMCVIQWKQWWEWEKQTQNRPRKLPPRETRKNKKEHMRFKVSGRKEVTEIRADI